MIFVDTGAWFAYFVPNDPDYSAANRWMEANSDLLITTDYVVDELLTLFKARGEYPLALRAGKRLVQESICKLHFVSAENMRGAWKVYSQFHDKRWSFTDCVSRVVIEQLRIDTAFAFDQDFRQFGNVTVVP